MNRENNSTVKEKIIAEDVTDITLKKAGYYWNAGYNEFEFICKIKGEDDAIYMTKQRHDDGTSFVINSEKDDIWERILADEAYKLEGKLQEAIQYGSYHRRIEKLETLQECKDLEWELMENENVYLKRVWEKVQSELKAKKTEIAGAEPEAEKMKTDADVPDAVAGFKERTNEKFHRIDGLGQADIERQVHDYVMDKIRDNGLDAEIIHVAVTGTRSRGIENKNSDIDVAVEYKGSIREDDFFDMLHEDGMTIAGIKLDINPITEGKTGTMENYLPAVEKHLEHKASDREKKKSVIKGIKEKCAGAKKSEPAKKKMKDHSSR